ncbi:hypothetical protein [Streptomyces sp. NPDC096193]|uniref:alpha/beta fold hydrolase n=1 Tax=Streptomyces sp. NPDC096193 TaxID=3155821 RepID=UPI00332E868E
MDVRNRNHVRVTGRAGGPVLVLSHEFGCDRNIWRLVATFLSDNGVDPGRATVPTPAIQCSNDAIARQEVGVYVRARIPGSEPVTLEATGHCPQLRAPEATATAIAAFAGATR